MSIKIIHTGDMHLGGAYAEKAAASIEFLLDQLENSDSPAFHPDLVVVTGDTTDKPLHVHSEHLNPLINLIWSVECPMVFLQGTPSHEPLNFLRNLEEAAGRGITVFDTPEVFMGKISEMPCKGTASDKQVAIATLPAVSRALLDQWTWHLLDHPDDDPQENIRALLGRIRNNWSDPLPPHWADFKGPKILLGHFTVSGCKTGTGQTLYGSDIAVSLEDLAVSGADAVLLGHIHHAQEWRDPLFVSYCGSTHPVNWGELDAKSFSVLEFDEATGKLVNFQRVPFPHKPMAKFDLEFTGEQQNGEWVGSCDSAVIDPLLNQSDIEVKCCYSVPKELAVQIDDMYVRIMFKNRGLDLAAVERTIKSTTRERIADIASKETTRQQYEAVCTAKSEDARPGALTKADMIDETGVPL